MKGPAAWGGRGAGGCHPKVGVPSPPLRVGRVTLKWPRWNRGGDWHPLAPATHSLPHAPSCPGALIFQPKSLSASPLPLYPLPALGSRSGVPVPQLNGLKGRVYRGQLEQWAPLLSTWGQGQVVRRPPGVAISLRGMCGQGKQMFLGGSDTCPWNSSQGPPSAPPSPIHCTLKSS